MAGNFYNKNELEKVTDTQRAIAEAVSRWLPTSAARVRARVWSCGICGGQCGAGADVLRVLWFPLTVFIPPSPLQSPSSIIWGLYNRPEVAAVPSGLSPTPQKKLTHKPAVQETKDKINEYFRISKCLNSCEYSKCPEETRCNRRLERGAQWGAS
jgi:hypothetical protein